MAILLVAGLAAVLPATASPSASCSQTAGTPGGGGAREAAHRQYANVQRLVDSLRPGQTGCLGSGIYYGNVRFPRGSVTLANAPGESATIVGRIYIPRGSDRVRVIGLHLDGRNPATLPSPSVNSAGDVFINDDVMNHHTAICFELGSDGEWGRATDTLIEHSHIHDCGVLPAANHEHGIYVANSLGARILGNVIDHNADRGIQLYWNAQRTTIAGNIIDHNGEGVVISGGAGYASNNNLIVNNVITNSLVRADVGSWWPDGGPKGKGNLVTRNCVYGGRWTIDLRGGGFAARHNLHVDPGYVRTAWNHRHVRPGSPCGRLLAGATILATGA